MKTWNRERKRTRDRLLEYDFSLVPPHPHSAGIPFVYPTQDMNLQPFTDELPNVYPWEEIHTELMEEEIYKVAKKNGFSGTAEELWNMGGCVMQGTLGTFPEDGDPNNLYLDGQTGILYYFKIVSAPINNTAANAAGARIIESNNEIHLYIPVRSYLIENTILNCGDAAEYID